MSVSDLITLTYANAQLAASGRVLTASQTAAIPSKITEASNSVCRWCGDRDFTRQTYDEVYKPSLEGTIDLRQIPVNGVSLVRGNRMAGLVVTNSATTTNLYSTVAFTSTGDEATGLTFTGLVLTTLAGGVVTPVPLTYASYPTLASMAGAIGAAGNGWAATYPSQFAGWPSSDLVGGDVAQDATGTGAEIKIFGEVLGGCKVNRKTGELSVGIGGGSSSVDSPRWGPYQDPADDQWGQKVRVLYDAGFDTIPEPVQAATALIVGKMLDDLTRDLSLISETVGRGSYTLDALGRSMFTPEVTSKLCVYRIVRT